MNALTPIILNEQQTMARAAEKFIQPGSSLPWWRNIYSLNVKQSRNAVPITKMVCLEGGFTQAKAFCQNYCEVMGYQFLTLLPQFSDLEFEMKGESAFYQQRGAEFSTKEKGKKED